MKMKIKIPLILCAVCLMAGCSPGRSTTPETSAGAGESTMAEKASEASEKEPVEEGAETEAVKELFAMDTYMTIRTVGARAEEAAEAAAKEIARLDALLSTGSETSEISVLNRETTGQVSEDTLILVERAKEFWQETEGAFDITVYPLMETWGFTSGEYRVPTESELTDLLQHVDMNAVQIDQENSQISFSDENVRIDLGGIAKGYTSARLMDLFREYDLKHAIVSLGGNVQVLGDKPDGSAWRIGIEDPSGSRDYLGVLETKDRAVITSGGYERYFEQDGKHYHHILDPSTGYPAESGLISVTIVSEDGTMADALSTSLFVMGKDKAIAFWQNHADTFEMILQEEDGTLVISEGLKDAFSTDIKAEFVSRK